MTLNGFWRAFVLNTVFLKVFFVSVSVFRGGLFRLLYWDVSIYFQILFFNWGEGVDCEHEVFRLPLICISLNENRDLISTSLFEVLCHMLKMRA